MTATHTADHLDDVLRRRMFMLAQSPSFPPRDNSSGRYDVILDSAAAECIIRDKELLANIRSAETAIEVVGIAPGHPSIKLDTVGDLFGLGTVFYSPLVAANVLSLADMEARHEVTYRKGSFEVKLASGNVVAFNRGASQHPGVGYSKHYVARFPRRFAVAPAIQGALGKGGEPSADEPPQGLVRATAACGRRAAVEVPKKKEIKRMKNATAARLLVQVGRAGVPASVRAAAETATEDPGAGAPATMHAAAEAAEVRGIGVPIRVLAAVEAAAEPPSAQEARAPLGEGVAPQQEAQELPQHTAVGPEAEPLATGARVHVPDAASLAMKLHVPDARVLDDGAAFPDVFSPKDELQDLRSDLLCLRQEKGEVDSPVGKSAKLNTQMTASECKQKREAIGEKAPKPAQKILSSIFLIVTAATISAQVAKGGTDYQSVAEINDGAAITLDPDKTLSHAEPGKEKILRQVLLNWRF
jgi:hypothetical protein